MNTNNQIHMNPNKLKIMKIMNYKILKTLAVSIFMGCSILSTQAQIYVDAAATTGYNDGSSWANAYTDLQPALDAASENAEIRVARGLTNPQQHLMIQQMTTEKKPFTSIKTSF